MEKRCHFDLIFPDFFATSCTLLRILLSSNSAVLINIITGVSLLCFIIINMKKLNAQKNIRPAHIL
jgi:hypothetical protein